MSFGLSEDDRRELEKVMESRKSMGSRGERYHLTLGEIDHEGKVLIVQSRWANMFHLFDCHYIHQCDAEWKDQSKVCDEWKLCTGCRELLESGEVPEPPTETEETDEE